MNLTKGAGGKGGVGLDLPASTLGFPNKFPTFLTVALPLLTQSLSVADQIRVLIRDPFYCDLGRFSPSPTAGLL